MSLKIKKIAAAILGFLLVTVLLFLVNSFVGNPISIMLAKNSAAKYISEKYSELDLEIDHAAFNFKFGEYFVFVQSQTSQDTKFSIYTDSYGNIKQDDYESCVIDKFNTFTRLDYELRETAEEIIGKKLDYDIEYVALRFTNDSDGSLLTLDMELDIHNPPYPLEVDMVVFSDDVSYEQIAEVAKATQAILLKEKIPVSEYSIRILPAENKPENKQLSVSWKDSIYVMYFPTDMLNEEDLPSVIEAYVKEIEGIMDKEKGIG